MLIDLAAAGYDVDLDLIYVRPDNLAGRPLYRRAAAYLHADAAAALGRAVALTTPLGLRLRLFDAFRPSAVQRALFEALPNPRYIADPDIGSSHTRGVAVDLTLTDRAGTALDMGTAVDDMQPQSRHGDTGLPPNAQRNRLLLRGLMHCGWLPYEPEWWHYQLPSADRYPLLDDVPGGPPLAVGQPATG